MTKLPLIHALSTAIILALSSAAIVVGQPQRMPSPYGNGAGTIPAQPVLNAPPPAGLGASNANAPQPMATGQTSDASLAQGRAILRQGQPQQAVNMFRNYTRLRPNDGYGHFWLGL